MRPDKVAADVQLGIGDDAALTRFPEGCDLVTATDSLVAGTHFRNEAAAASVGHRALAVNLSDIAAMGATPLWASLAIASPDADFDWLGAFAEGFFTLADSCGVSLIGGDTVHGPLAATVTVQGWVARGEAIRRDGAGSGDRIYVSGYPGEAAAGRLLASGELAAEESAQNVCAELIRKFEYPRPRLREGVGLSGLATAMIDISDGLHVDLERLLAASSCGANLDVDAIPVSPGQSAVTGIDKAIELALCGGEDYELCFTVPPAAEESLARLAASWECPLACLGEVNAAAGLRWFREDEAYIVPSTGFDHFT